MPKIRPHYIVYILASFLFFAPTPNAFSQRAESGSTVIRALNPDAIASGITNTIRRDPHLREQLNQRSLNIGPISANPEGPPSDTLHVSRPIPMGAGGDPTKQETLPDTVDRNVYYSVGPLGEAACPEKDIRCRKSINRVLVRHSAEAGASIRTGTGAHFTLPSERAFCQNTLESNSSTTSFIYYLSNVGTLYSHANTVFSGEGILSAKEKQDLIDYVKKCYALGVSERLAPFIGILIDSSSNELVGMATLLTDSTAITAAHVLYKLDENDRPTTPRNIQDLRLILASDTSRALKIKQTAIMDGWSASDPTAQNLDQAILTLADKTDTAGPFPEQIIVPLDKDVELRIPGLSLAYYQANVAQKNIPADPEWENWPRYVVTDTKNACAVSIELDNGCVVHGCSTFKGMSGAGVFLNDFSDSSGPPKLVAVHGGSLFAYSACSALSVRLPRINVASRVIR